MNANGTHTLNGAAHANTQALHRLIEAWRWQDEVRNPPKRPPIDGRAAIVQRAKLYVAREPPAISGQHGHDRAFHVACVLVQGFDLTEDEGFAAIQNWNATCVPPWSEAELRHKLADAAKQPGERGHLLRSSFPSGNRGHTTQPPPVEVPAVEADDVATIADLIRAGSEVQWLWEGWLPTGVLTALAAEGGTGKTRFCADLLRRVRHGLPWPDGQEMTVPPDALSLWVMADNHHDEIVTLARAFDIEDTVRINAPRSDPYQGVTLETADDLAALEGRIRAVRPAFVIIDTVGNATDLNLSRQEDAKAFYHPLQILARRYRCVFLCLTHLNATGKFLGRRVLEKVRVAIRMDKPDPANERRGLEVAKSNSKRPAPLGVTMHDLGNDYDFDPPRAPDRADEPGQNNPRLQEAMEWLQQRLSMGSARVSVLRSEMTAAGFSSKTIYQAKERLGVEERLIETRKWWELTSLSEEV